MFDGTSLNSSAAALDDLLPALQHLDRQLERAVAAAQVAYGPEAATDPYRGLHIDPEEVERLLAREPGTPAFQVDGETLESSPPDLVIREDSQLAWLQRSFGLSLFDLDLILIALAPELDRRYERLYAYLQDDVRCRRPSVELALNLLCTSAAAKLVRRAHFSPEAPLIRHGLLHLIPDPNQVEPPLLSHYLKLDEQVVRLLLGQEGLDSRLASFCRLIEPAVDWDELPLSDGIKQALPTLVAGAWEARQPLRLYFCGPSGAGKRRAAEALAGEVGVPLLVADLVRALEVKGDFEQILKLLFREAWFQDAILYLEGWDALRCPERSLSYRSLLEGLAEATGAIVLAGVQPWVPDEAGPKGVITVSFPIPDFAQRQVCWQENLAAAGMALDGYDLDALANRFRLTPDQIADAVATACNHSLWRAAGLSPNEQQSLARIQPTINELFATARDQSGHDLTALARKIEPKYVWEDIVLPPDPLAQLREICNQAKYRHLVYDEWGFDRKLSIGKGLNVLFSGPPGTGKTMAAEVIANELQLDLYKIDLSQVVSKYIGETEKNLDRIFTAAENANGILFFDEADALFGKRSEVRDAHDRYANIEIGYLLQKMEEYEGVAILATNLRQNLDEAFVRRLAFMVHFPSPDEAHRRQIWAGIWPPQAPLAADVDLDRLARQFKLSGGNIKNIAVAAAFLAAGTGESVGMNHLLQATRREYQKLGKVLSEAELDGVREAGKGKA